MARRKPLNSLGTLRDKLDQLDNSRNQLGVTDIQTAPSQPRRYFDEDKLLQLEQSIRIHGILEPLIVRPLDNGKYELVAGERRFRAAERIGLELLPVVVKELDDVEAAKLSLIENLQREDLNPFEETEGILLLLSTELKIALDEVSPLLHRLQHQNKSRENSYIGSELEVVQSIFISLGKMTWESFVNNRLPLLNLPDDVSSALREGKLAYTKAKAIAQIKDIDDRTYLLGLTLEEDLPLSAIREQVKSLAITSDNTLDRSLKNRMSSAVKKLNRSDVWSSPSKQKKLEKLLGEIEKLIG
jgi:ParB family transcriptional regulator, chromosome partitioning protein